MSKPFTTLILFPLVVFSIVLFTFTFWLNYAPLPIDPHLEFIKKLELHVHDTGKIYSYPDRHVKILAIEGRIPMVYVGIEDLEDLRYAQWADCVLWVEYVDGIFYVEGRMTGGYRKTLYLNTSKGKMEIATYFDKVWFTFEYDLETEEIRFGEYW